MPNDVRSSSSSATAISSPASSHVQAGEKPAGAANPQPHADLEGPKPRGWVARSEFATWNLFTANMGTGGVAILLGGCNFSFRGQRELGTIFFFFDLILFIVNAAFFTTMLVYHPRAFKKSLYDHENGLFLPCVMLAIATLFVCVLDYGVPYVGFWLTRAMFVVWVVYIALALCVGMLLEYTIHGRRRDLSTITPADLLPVFPLMLAGTLGSGLASKLPASQQGYVIVMSYMFQSMGLWIGLLKLSTWMTRNLTMPNPSTDSLPGYLMAVGPPGFTAFAFLNLGDAAVGAFPASDILGGAEAGRVFLYVSVWFSFMLYGMCLWLIFTPMTSLICSITKKRDFEWSMGCWSFTFPLVGFFMANAKLGSILPSTTFSSVQVLGIFIVGIAWLINVPFMFYQVFVSRKLLVPKPPKEVEETIVQGDEEATVAVEPASAGLKPRPGAHTGKRRTGEDAPAVAA